MPIKTLIILATVHAVADWFLQSRETANNKSSKFSYLLHHLVILALGLGVFSYLAELPRTFGAYFLVLNVVLHGVIDWNIWKLYKFLVRRRFPDATATNFKFYEDKLFYDFIAIDQLLHALCYFGSYALLEKLL